MNLGMGSYTIYSSTGKRMGDFSINEFNELKMSNNLSEFLGPVSIDDLSRMFLDTPYYRIVRTG